MITISLPKRAVAVGLAFAVAILLTGAVSVIPTASADDTTDHTIEQLQEQITSLQDQLAALSGGDGGGGECYAFTRDLYNGVGSGDDVTALQDYLTGTGHFTFSGGSTGYFGPITQTAAGAWQADNGVAPTAGYWGPISRAAYNSVCTPGDGDGVDDDADAADLEGGACSIRNADFIATLRGEGVGEGRQDGESWAERPGEAAAARPAWLRRCGCSESTWVPAAWPRATPCRRGSSVRSAGPSRRPILSREQSSQ